MSKSNVLTGKLHLLCGASLLAIALAAPSASADEAKAADAKSAKETQVAQNATPPSTPAPEAESAPVEKVTVTGFRRSLRSALDQKKNSNAQIDVVKAEDVAKFPDLNLSESLQRIPGVSITRDAGEGRQITVRGLGPQFTRIRINGMEALSTAGGTDAAGGTNRGRAFDFNVFAADLFSTMTVRKTPSAETEEGSLGATVDLRAARPFDFDGFTAAVSGAYGWNDLSESFDPRASGLVSWSDGTFGALFSIAYSDREMLEAGASTVRWQNDGSTRDAAGVITGGAANARFQSESVAAYSLAEINNAFRPRIPRYDIYEHEQQRLGMTGSLQWRPAESTTVTLDAMYSKLESGRNEIFLETPVFSTTGAAAIQDVDVLDAVIQGNSLVYGVFNDVDIRSEFRHDDLSTEYSQATLEIDHVFSDVFHVNLLGGYAESDHQNPVQTTLLFDASNVDGYSYDFRGNNRLPLITYGTTDVTNPATWTLTQIRLRPQTALNTYTSLHAGADYDALDWLTFKAGFDWKSYEFETTEKRRDATQFPGLTAPGCTAGTVPTIISNAEGCLPANVISTPISSYSRLVTLSDDGLDIPAGNVNTWLIPDLDAAASLWNLYNTALFPTRFEPALGNNASVKEDSTGGYFQSDFVLPNTPIRGNVGFRYVGTDQTSTGYTFRPAIADNPATPLVNEAQPAAVVTTTVERSYEDWLPSANLVLEADENLLIRLGLSKVMSRAGLQNLTPGATLSVAGSNRTVTAGNPNLDPFRAENFDLAVEWYPQPGALFGVAMFHKNITSFSFTLRNDMPFTGNPLGLPDELAIAACGSNAGCSPSALWQFNIPTNTNGGEVSGFELNWQQPLNFLPTPFDNLGVLFNYTYVKSDIDYLGTVVGPGGVVSIVSQAKDDLLNLSRNAYNATLYYDDPTWSARVSAAYRDKYLTTIPGRNGNISEATAGTLNIDFQVSYSFDDNLKLTLEGLNMTDEVNDQYLNPDDRVSFYHNFGRQFFLGFRYTY